MAVRCCRKFKEHASVRSLTTEMFSFSSSFFLLFLVFFVRGVRFGEASLPATPSIFFFFVLVPTFVPGEVTTLVLVVIVSSRLSLCVNRQKQIFIVLSVTDEIPIGSQSNAYRNSYRDLRLYPYSSRTIVLTIITSSASIHASSWFSLNTRPPADKNFA